MCKFFSFVTKGSQKYYFDWPERVKLLKSNPDDYNPDSHCSISAKFKLDGDKVNKYEYNPLTGEFNVDQICIKDDQALAKKWVEKLDFKTIVEPLIIKPIIHPFEITSPEITDKHIELLKQWTSFRDSVRDSVMASFRASVWDSVGDSVGASVGASVWDSVRASVRDSVGDSVWDSVWDSVRDSVWDSVGASVGASVWDSVRDSVRASVWDSVGAYMSSFFDIKKWKYINHKEGENPFQCCIDLWEQGLVPNFDGGKWRLHGGGRVKILYEMQKTIVK